MYKSITISATGFKGYPTHNFYCTFTCDKISTTLFFINDKKFKKKGEEDVS